MPILSTLSRSRIFSTGYAQISNSLRDPFSRYNSIVLKGDAFPFVDSTNKNVVTNNGGVTQNTTTLKYGVGSMQFSGAQTLSVPRSSLFDFTTGNGFTIECWVNFSSLPASPVTIMGSSEGGGPNRKWTVIFNSNTSFVYSANQFVLHTTNASNVSTFVTGSYTWTTGTWYHVAISSTNGTAIQVYVQGKLIISGNLAFPLEYVNSNIRFGGDGESWKFLNGYMDEIRVTNGYSRYTADFNPVELPAF